MNQRLLSQLRMGLQVPEFDLRQAAADEIVRLHADLKTLRARIRDLEAEVERLKQPLSIVDQETGEQLHPDATITHRVADVMQMMQRIEELEADYKGLLAHARNLGKELQAAEAKLAKIQGCRRYGLEYVNDSGDEEFYKVEDIRAILQPDAEGRE